MKSYQNKKETVRYSLFNSRWKNIFTDIKTNILGKLKTNDDFFFTAAGEFVSNFLQLL